MRSLIAALSLFIASPIIAQDYIATLEGDTVRLTEKACPESVKKLLQQVPERWHLALARVDGVEFVGCWVYRPEDQKVLLIYSDGDGGAVPVQMFKAVPTI